MFEYSICTTADESVFKKQCLALEKNIPGIHKGRLLQDVDASKVQMYELNGQEITVHNSYYTDAVFIRSALDLIPYFQ